MPASSAPIRFEKPLLLIILAVAAFMRFYHLGEISLSNDELSAMFRANHHSFSELIDKGVLIDYHPAGVQVFVYYWLRLFGNGVFVYRLPFVLLSLASIYLIYKIGKQWFGTAIGLWTASLFAVLEYPLLYSMLARMYSPGLFFSLLAVLYWTAWVRASQDKRPPPLRTQAGLFISIALGVHTHYFTVAFLFSMVVLGLFFICRKELIRYVLVCGAASLTFLLEWRIFLAQMKTGDLGGWLGKPEPTFINDFLFNFINDSILLLSVFGALWLFGLLYGFRSIRLTRFHFAGVSWFFFTFLLAYLYSIYRHPAIQFSTLLFCMPFFVMAVIGLVPSKEISGRMTVFVAMLLLSAGAYSTVVERRYYTQPPFGVFKDVAADIATWSKQTGKQNIAALVNVITPDYINYYMNRSPVLPSFMRYKVETPDELAEFREYIDALAKTTPFYAYAWTNNLHPYEILSILRSRYPGVKAYHSYYNAESWLFCRDYIHQDTSLISQWNIDFEDLAYGEIIQTDTNSVSGKHLALFKEHMEYSPGLDQDVHVDARKFYVFSGSVWYRSADVSGNQALVFEVLKNGKSLDWYSVPLKSYNLHPGKWQQAFLARPLPVSEGVLKLKAYVWNPDHKVFAVDNLVAKLEIAVDPYSRK
jgi:hypothetical protein